ncbi:hypothetical protein TIFTF001_029028 [Ficus carica]|uniref:Uncharacterized protein n=1 Tax=Ficus carica TaxID=3494 RepID=A0AA88DR32_FICCA|nr:hypothetical protein TIFTF001_029028 [Ficus carica]
MANDSVPEGNPQELRLVDISYPYNEKFYEIKQGSDLLTPPYSLSSPTQADPKKAVAINQLAYELSDRAVRDQLAAVLGILPILIASTCFEIFIPTLVDVLQIFQLPIGDNYEDPFDVPEDNSEQA